MTSGGDIAEVGAAIDAVRRQMETLCVRGLATASAADRQPLASQAEEWMQLGAVHVGQRLRALLVAAAGDSREAPRLLLSAYTSLNVLERVLSSDISRELFTAWRDGSLGTVELPQDDADDDGDDDEDQPPAKPVKAAKPAKAPKAKRGKPAKAEPERHPARITTLHDADPVAATAASTATPPTTDDDATRQLAEELVKAVEELIRTGLVSATDATRVKLDATFKEASRHKLLRIGASLRYVNEEIGRYLADDGTFSQRRFGLFLHRSWLLAKGLLHALQTGNRALGTRLSLGAGHAPQPVKRLELCTLGVLKRVVSTACTFDFRLRIVAGPAELVGKSVTWSFIFARKSKEVPAEAYLHLPQPQKFKPSLLIEPRRIVVENAALSRDDRGNLRLLLGPPSTVVPGADITDWPALYQWNVANVIDRATRITPGPLDLAIEAQEEVMLVGWTTIPDELRSTPERHVYAISAQIGPASVLLDAIVPAGADGVELHQALGRAVNTPTPMPLFGLAYAEFGRMNFLPLSYLTDVGPQHLMWSPENIDVAALMKTLTIS